MTQPTSLGAKIAAAVVGGFVGLCLGIVFGSAAGALIGNAFGSPGPGPFDVGHTLGMGAGLYDAAYATEPFVEVVPEPPGVREVRETNYCRIHALVHEHTGKVVVFSALDNLWKGTSSQAVQNLNLMFGRDETEGLL